MLQNKKAVIFDLDGTLVDSMWLWEEIDIEFLGERGIALPDGFQQEIDGMSFTETAEYSISRFRLTETVEELKQIWNGMAMDKYTHEVKLKPGAGLFLKRCRQLGIKMGIATSNSRELVNAAATALGLFDYIDVIITSCDVSRGKPAPDVYLEAARQLSVLPSECLVFEDIPAGISAGKNAGMTVCAVEDDYSGSQLEKKKELADYYICSYEQVLNGTYE